MPVRSISIRLARGERLMNRLLIGRVGRVAVAAALLLLLAGMSPGYSVLTHEAIIDSVWDTGIKPSLTRRFGPATEADLRKAHSYAYGGAIIQDMGYYPFGSRLFSDLAHYVRSGDFVQALIREAQDINEYSFALGSLCHYAADNTGHPLAVNRSVPILYPQLRRKYGGTVTYEDDPTAHVRTEFGFDVLQVAHGRYASEDFHDFIGFQVSKPLLERAFKDTYGIEAKSLFKSLDLALGTYRRSVSTLIPEMTKVAWLSKQGEIEKENPGITAEKFRYVLPRPGYEKEWGNQYEKPGLGSRLLSIAFRIVPRIGPFKALSFKVPTPEAERLFLKSVESTTARYRQLLADLQAGHLQLQDLDFDTGQPTRIGEYRLCDRAYAELLDRLARNKFEDVSPDLRNSILAFFEPPGSAVAIGSHIEHWQKTLQEINTLRATEMRPVETRH
jgi:hypothetical protein